jgi:hypothetical protein
LSSSDPSVTHTYARTGRFFGKLNAKFHGEGLRSFSIWAASGTIDFASHTLSLGEGTSVAVAVVRTGNLARPGTVDYRTTGPILPHSGTLAFAAGEARKDLLISAPDDALWNGESQHAEITLSNPTEDWVFGPNTSNQVSVTVLEDDVAAIHRCAQTELHANERDRVATFELTRSQNTSVTTTGYVAISSGGDFFSSAFLHVTFAPGETERSVDLRWEDNSVYHGTRKWDFYCGGERPGGSFSTSDGTITITDDEPYPTLITPPSIEVTETDTPQQIAIPLTFVPPFGYFVSMDVVLEHETSSDADLKILPFHYPYDKIELEITGDDLPEPDESLYVRLTGPVQKWIPLTIVDDDRPPFPFTFDRESYEFDEALGGGIVVVQRTGSLSSAVQLLLRIDPNIPGAEVEMIPVLLAAGESSKEVPLALDDGYYTGTRHATMTLELDGFVGATASLTVKDDEAIPLLSIGDASVREGDPGQYTRLEFPVTLSAPVGAPLQLSVSSSHVSTDAADFRAALEPLTIPQGELTTTAIFFVNGDSAHEADETFNVTITSCCDGLATVARQTGTGTIVNDDDAPPPPPPPTQTLYHLFLGATSFTEAHRWLPVFVYRSGIISGTTHAILKLTASDERVFAPRTVSFAPNETVKDVQFYIDDFSYSGNTTVDVELFDDDRLLETKSVTILDDERRPFTTVWGGTAREGDARNAVPLRVSVSPPSRKPILLRLHSRSGDSRFGSAMLGEDFPLFDKTVELPPGTTDFEILVPILNDQIKEDTESFYVDVTIVDGDWIPPVTVWIADDEIPYIESEPYMARGTLTTITVHFPTPAPSSDAMYFLADPATLEGPFTVPVPGGATSVSFQALPKRSGDALFAVEPPSFLRTSRIEARTGIFDEHTMTLVPAALELAPGASARVEVTTWPASVGFSRQSTDWTIAAIEGPANTVGNPWFLVYGLAPGQTEIVVKLPASVGGGTVRLPVVVKEPEEPVTGRRRATRH